MNTTIKKSEIEVRTTRFEFAHSRKPSGTGTWAFEIKGEVYFFNGSYSECKKSAVSKAIEVGAYTVIVCS